MKTTGKIEKHIHTSAIVKLMSHPFVAAMKVQSKMVDKYLETVKKLAYKDEIQLQAQPKKQKPRKTNVLKFLINRIFRSKTNDTVEKVTQKIQVPPISLVKVPALTVKEVSAHFALEISSSSAFETNFEDQISDAAKLTTTQSRSTDATPKYTMKMTARRQEPTAGMSKLTEIMANTMKPIEA